MSNFVGNLYARRTNLWGDAKLQGTAILADGNPAVGRIELWTQAPSQRARPGVPLLQTHSDPASGAWEFLNIEMGRRYTVIAYDISEQFDPVIKVDRIPESME